MITLIGGALIIAFWYALFGKIAIFIGVPIAILCLLLPIEGYDPRTCELTELLSLKTDDEKEYYVEYNKNKVKYAFDNSGEYNLAGDAYEEAYVKGNIKIYDSKSCTNAILKKYTTKPTRGVFTFAPFTKTKIEYIFYIPANTVKYEDKEK